MNIYKYIRSKDVREYNEKIGRKFNALESCYFVWSNFDVSLTEKHEAWRQIFLELPDMEVKGMKYLEHISSLNELIEKFIWTDKVLINEFYREGDKAIYQYRFACEDDDWCDDRDFYAPYSSCENAKNALIEENIVGISLIEYKKQYLDYPDKNIVLRMKRDGTIMEIVSKGFDELFLEKGLKAKKEFFENIWIDIPAPFQIGDIVCSKKMPFREDIYQQEEPFVLTHIGNWASKDSLKGKITWRGDLQKKRIDSFAYGAEEPYEMSAHGYFLKRDEVGCFTGEFCLASMYDYTDLEYYRGEYKGGGRVLLPLKSFLKGETNEEILVQTCEIIKKQEQLRDDIWELEVCDHIWLDKFKIVD